MLQASVVVIAALLAIPGNARAEVLKICAGAAPYENVFSKVDAAFEKETGIKVELVCNYRVQSAVDTFRTILDGKADGGAAGTTLEDWKRLMREKAHLENSQMENISGKVIGQDVLVVLTHKANPVNALTMEQLKDVFSGKIKNWKVLGGKDEPVQVVMMTSLPATVDFFRKKVLGETPFVTEQKKVHAVSELVTVVSGTRGAIGFTVRMGGLGTVKTLDTPPVTRPLLLIHKGAPSPALQKFLDFLHKHPAT